MEDRRVGNLILADPETTLVIIVAVTSDLCPSVQWRVDGMNIKRGSDYTFSDCSNSTSNRSYWFTLDIIRLTSQTTGNYSAVFTVLHSSVSLPGLYVTFPGELTPSHKLAPLFMVFAV